jgi:hypothetical protein
MDKGMDKNTSQVNTSRRTGSAKLGDVGQRELDHVRRIALALPEVEERLSHGATCFFVRGKRPLCYFHDDHRGDGRISLWCPAPLGVQQELVGSEPARFFAPTPSAGGTFSDWVGVYLDTRGQNRVDWSEVAAIVEEAFRMVAPKGLVAQLDTR